MLLCAAHHKVVDDQVASYGPKKLREIKRAHEDWDSKSFSADVAHKTMKSFLLHI